MVWLEGGGGGGGGEGRGRTFMLSEGVGEAVVRRKSGMLSGWVVFLF
jgi:hypothetical protein